MRRIKVRDIEQMNIIYDYLTKNDLVVVKRDDRQLFIEYSV